MGWFRKAVHDEYSDGCFRVYLLCYCQQCQLSEGTTALEAKRALADHWTNHWEFFQFSNVDQQVNTVKKQLYRARNQIAKEAASREWSARELADFAASVHKANIAGQSGDSQAHWVVRHKVELLEQFSILEVCAELGLDLFDAE